MNILKSILLSTTVIASVSFGAESSSELDDDTSPPARKASRLETAASSSNQRPGLNGGVPRVKVTARSEDELSGLPSDDTSPPERKASRLETASSSNQRLGLNGGVSRTQGIAAPSSTPVFRQRNPSILPDDLWESVVSFLTGAEMTKFFEAIPGTAHLKASQDRALLNKNYGGIISALLFTQKRVYDIMQENNLTLPKQILSTLGIKEDVSPLDGQINQEEYTQTDRLTIARKLAAYAEKPFITAADIAKGAVVKDGDNVVLGYDELITHQTALAGKDIQLYVDVYADANGEVVFDHYTYLPKGVKKLYFQNTREDVTTIVYGFLYEWEGFNPHGCKRLTHVGFSGFTNVTTIGEGFLSSSQSLTSVDLSGFKNVTTIERNFLSNCFGLTHVGFSAFTNVTTIGDGFLTWCEGLTHVDLSGFTNVKTISDNFLARCFRLTSVDLSGLTNVRTIGNKFLDHCSGLRKVDLSGLKKLESIMDKFLFSCESLTQIIILKSMDNLKSTIIPPEHREKIIEVVE